MKRIAPLFCAALLVLAAAFAADVTGTWKGSLNGDRELTFKLKADGNHLTGTVAGLRDKEVAIEKGAIQGSTVTFSVQSEWQGNPITLVYKGEVSGDEIRFTMGTEDGGWSTELTAKRVSS